jgi:hypothetical protein
MRDGGIPRRAQAVPVTGRRCNFPLPLGSLMTGEICIPGMSLSGHSEANVIPYELRLLEWGPAADTLMVAHCAYGDTQLCHLQVRVLCSVLGAHACVAVSTRNESLAERVRVLGIQHT